MAGNFGIGLGSFMSGFGQGAQMYQGIQESKSRQKLRDIQVKEAENDYAEKVRNQDIQAEVNRIGQVGLDSAKVEYGDDVKKVLNHYYTNTIPQQQQHLISAGKVEAAEMLGKFMETKQAKQLTETSAQAIKQASMGDYANMGPTIETLLNTSSSVTGGGTYKFKSMVEATDDKGQKTGGVSFAVTDSNGKEQVVSFNNSSELVGFIRNNAMPDKIVEYAYDQDQQAKKVRAETAKDQREWGQKIAEKGLDFKYDIVKKKTDHEYKIAENRAQSGLRMEEENNRAQVQAAYGTGSGNTAGKKVAEAEATIAFLRKNNVPEEYIQANLSAIVGLENKTRPMSSRIDDYVKMRSGADLGFGKMTPEKQIAEARKYIAAVDSQNGTSGSEVANPFSEQGAAKPPSKGLTPYFDNKTNSIVYR